MTESASSATSASSDGRRPAVSVVIPAYNEARSIGAIVAAVRAQHPDFEVLVVDDGSRDDTADLAAAAGARVVRHPHNLGNGAAVKNGLRHATGRTVVLMDGDGQHDPREIPRLLEHVDRHDMVVAARTRRAKVSRFRALGNVLLARFASYLAGSRIPDLTSGFRAIRRELALDYVPILPNRYSYPTTITLALLKSGHAVKFVPTDAVTRRVTGVSNLRPLRDGLRALLTIVRMVSLFAPLRVFLPAALALALVGVVAAVWGQATGAATGTVAAVALLVAALVLFLGLAADRRAYVRRAVTRRAAPPEGAAADDAPGADDEGRPR